MRWVSSARYTVDTGGHTFPTAKFERAGAIAVEERLLRAEDRVEPPEPSREDLLLVHSADWVDRALGGRLTPEEQTRLELPWSAAAAQAHALSVSGTILACRHALEQGLGLHLGGGAHHAFPDHGEGFCLFNDIACAIRRLRGEGRLERSMVVDLDVHQGNGTAAIFREDPAVFTFSMHQREGYPEPREKSTLDVELPAGTKDREYVVELARHLPAALEAHKPQLVIYQAGVDVYERDLLGSLKLSAAGVSERDRFVFGECARRAIPIALTLGGGYCADAETTATLHVNTVRDALGSRRRG